MSQQRTNTKWAVALIAIIAGMGMLAEGDAEEHQRAVLAYCEGVAIWEAEKARAIPRQYRAGHLDWDEGVNVEEDCPGMRPAVPAVTTQQRQFASQN